MIAAAVKLSGRIRISETFFAEHRNGRVAIVSNGRTIGLIDDQRATIIIESLNKENAQFWREFFDGRTVLMPRGYFDCRTISRRGLKVTVERLNGDKLTMELKPNASAIHIERKERDEKR